MQDPLLDTGINYSDSYSPTRGFNFQNIESLGNAGDFATVGSMDDATANLVKRTISEKLSNPGIEPLPMDQYYPGMDRPLQVGTFSGPLGSIPLFAAGTGYDPLGVLEAKNLARQGIKDEYQKQMFDAINYDYINTKHAILNERFLENQEKWHTQDWDRLLQKAGGDAIVAAQLAKSDPETKLLNAKIKNLGAAADQMFDMATTIHLQSFNKDPNTYWSPKMVKMADDFLSFYTKQDMDLEDLKDFDPSKFASALSIEKAAKQTMDIRSKENMDNATTKIQQAVISGTLKNLNTDKTNVYDVQKIIGLSNEDVYDMAKADYEAAYGSAYEYYGKAANDVVPNFEKEFLPYYQKLVHQQVTDVLYNVSKSGILDQVKAKKITQELQQNVKSEDRLNAFGEKVKRWNIENREIEIQNFSPINNRVYGKDKTGNTVELPNTEYKVVSVDKGLTPSATGNVAVTANVVPLKVNPDGSNYWDYENSYNVRYNDVKSSVETKLPSSQSSGGKVPEMEGFSYGKVTPYVNYMKDAQQTSETGTGGLY